ncbi:MAG: hypothetical protein FJ309_14215 [Planctomycetes bacterium]|nr:hypothetical protein [Planctomycetota bacterium]
MQPVAPHPRQPAGQAGLLPALRRQVPRHRPGDPPSCRRRHRLLPRRRRPVGRPPARARRVGTPARRPGRGPPRARRRPRCAAAFLSGAAADRGAGRARRAAECSRPRHRPRAHSPGVAVATSGQAAVSSRASRASARQ